MNVQLNFFTHHRRTYLYGSGKLTGTVLNAAGNPIGREVQLWTHADVPTKYPRIKGLYLKAISDPETGRWTFNNIEQSARFTVIAHDSAGEYDPVIKTNLRPEPME